MKFDIKNHIPPIPWFLSEERGRLVDLCLAIPRWKRFYLCRIKNRRDAFMGRAYWAVAKDLLYSGNEELFELIVRLGDGYYFIALEVKKMGYIASVWEALKMDEPIDYQRD